MSQITVRGKLSEMPDVNTTARFVAAAPADSRGSFSGSGLPFASEEQAFTLTPNQGDLDLGPDGSFTVELLQPNSYYRGLGTDLIPPTLYVRYLTSGKPVTLSSALGFATPFRTLTYPSARHDVGFYDRGGHNDLHPDRDARTQEQIFRETAYPSAIHPEPTDFWGLVTPQ